MRVHTRSRSGDVCLCPTGYTGTSCEQETEPPPVSKFSELNAQEGSIIACEVGKLCIQPINTNTDHYEDIINNNETLQIKGLTENAKMRLVVPNINNMRSQEFDKLHVASFETFIQPMTGESGKVTFSVLENNVSVDSVSYTYEFVEKPPTPSLFVEGYNVPSESRLVCDGICRFLVVTKPLPNNTCVQVDAPCVSAWSFPTILSASNCYTEIVFESDPCQQLCVSVRDTTSTLCYWRFPSVQESATCGCDPVCKNITVVDECCPQNRTVDVCDTTENRTRLSTQDRNDSSKSMVIGLSVGTSMTVPLAVVAVVCFLKFKTWFGSKVENVSSEASKDQNPMEKSKTPESSSENLRKTVSTGKNNAEPE